MPNAQKLTNAVAVTFTLHSSAADPPYYISGCSARIAFDDQSEERLTGWGDQHVGKPRADGSDFSVEIVNADHQNDPCAVVNWALTFIPRGPTREASPFGNNQNTITGTGSPAANGITTLDLRNNKIKRAGTWDWAVLVQVQSAGGTVKCFASDPKMQVDA